MKQKTSKKEKKKDKKQDQKTTQKARKKKKWEEKKDDTFQTNLCRIQKRPQQRTRVEKDKTLSNQKNELESKCRLCRKPKSNIGDLLFRIRISF